LREFFSQFAPNISDTEFGKEIWQLYRTGLLTKEIELTGKVEEDHRSPDVQMVLDEIAIAESEFQAELQRKAMREM